MPDIYLGRFSRWIEKWLNIKGGPALVDLEPSIRATAAIAIGNEDRYLQGWNRYGIAVGVAAVAAQFVQAQIRNPPNSNVMVVVESLQYATGGVDQPTLTWGATITDLATVIPLTFTRLDPRGNPQPTAIVSQTADGANAAVFQQQYMLANTTVQFIPTVNCEFTVLPGQILKAFSNVANQTATFNFLWRERPLESSELA